MTQHNTPRPMRKTLLALCMAAASISWAQSEPAPPTMSDGWQFVQTDGASLYRASCQACHMPQGQGAKGAGMYPALAGNPRVASANYVAFTVLKGRKGMPGFKWTMTDAQVAEVVNFVRGNFGNAYAEPIAAAEVAALR